MYNVHQNCVARCRITFFKLLTLFFTRINSRSAFAPAGCCYDVGLLEKWYVFSLTFGDSIWHGASLMAGNALEVYQLHKRFVRNKSPIHVLALT